LELVCRGNKCQNFFEFDPGSSAPLNEQERYKNGPDGADNEYNTNMGNTGGVGNNNSVGRTTNCNSGNDSTDGYRFISTDEYVDRTVCAEHVMRFM
jgi:hypothetical protein